MPEINEDLIIVIIRKSQRVPDDVRTDRLPRDSCGVVVVTYLYARIRIHQQQYTLARSERAGHFIMKVHVTLNMSQD